MTTTSIKLLGTAEYTETTEGLFNHKEPGLVLTTEHTECTELNLRNSLSNIFLNKIGNIFKGLWSMVFSQNASNLISLAVHLLIK